MGSNYLYYAVNRGRKKGVYISWADCCDQVLGYPNAKYKGFYSLKEAERFVDWLFYAVKSKKEIFKRENYADWDTYWKEVEKFQDGDRQGFDTEEEAKRFIGNTFYAIKIEDKKEIYYDLDSIKEMMEYPKVELYKCDNKKDAEKFLNWPFYAVKSEKEIFKREDYDDWNKYWKEVEGFTDGDRKGFDTEEAAEKFIKKYYVINFGDEKGLYENIDQYYKAICYDLCSRKYNKKEITIEEQEEIYKEGKEIIDMQGEKKCWIFNNKEIAENFLEIGEKFLMEEKVEESAYKCKLIKEVIKEEEIF